MNKEEKAELIKETNKAITRTKVEIVLLQEDLENLKPDLISKDNPEGMNNRKLRGFYKANISKLENTLMRQERALEILKAEKWEKKGA